MKRAYCLGGSAPKPPGFIAFFQPEWLYQGAAMPPPGPIPAAEAVARVASQHCPIPSGSGTIILQQMFSAGYEKPANGNLSLISVPQRWGAVHPCLLLFFSEILVIVANQHYHNDVRAAGTLRVDDAP